MIKDAFRALTRVQKWHHQLLYYEHQSDPAVGRLSGERHWLCCLLGVKSWTSEKTLEVILIVTDFMEIKMNWTSLNLIMPSLRPSCPQSWWQKQEKNESEDLNQWDDWVRTSPGLQLLLVLLVCTWEGSIRVVRGEGQGHVGRGRLARVVQSNRGATGALTWSPV